MAVTWSLTYKQCHNGKVAFTGPGSPVIHLNNCPNMTSYWNESRSFGIVLVYIKA